MNKALHGLLGAIDVLTRRLQEQLEYVLVFKENHAAAKATRDKAYLLEEFARKHPLKPWQADKVKELPTELESTEDIPKDHGV